MQGVGGYGGISTMNQDQRKGHFGPHTVARYLDMLADVYHIKCISCRLEWTMTKKAWFDRDFSSMPPECKRAEPTGPANESDCAEQF